MNEIILLQVQVGDMFFTKGSRQKLSDKVHSCEIRETLSVDSCPRKE